MDYTPIKPPKTAPPPSREDYLRKALGTLDRLDADYSINALGKTYTRRRDVTPDKVESSRIGDKNRGKDFLLFASGYRF